MREVEVARSTVHSSSSRRMPSTSCGRGWPGSILEVAKGSWGGGRRNRARQSSIGTALDTGGFHRRSRNSPFGTWLAWLMGQVPREVAERLCVPSEGPHWRPRSPLPRVSRRGRPRSWVVDKGDKRHPHRRRRIPKRSCCLIYGPRASLSSSRGTLRGSLIVALGLPHHSP
ncbi:MAG: hypothetical protein ACI8QS_000769 [Planctomycetota bacterium]|jgi:hypothetical protein